MVKKPKKPAAKKTTKKKTVAKTPQPHWLRHDVVNTPASIELPTAETQSAPQQPRAPPRLMPKAEVLQITGTSFPTIWQWMRTGSFPRSRIVGGRSMWMSNEVETWLQQLPRRALKGDRVKAVS